MGTEYCGIGYWVHGTGTVSLVLGASRSAGNNRAGVSPVPTLAHVTHLAGTQTSSIWSYSLQTTLQFRAFRMGLTQSIFQRYKMDPRCI